jgi:hypothetical protein
MGKRFLALGGFPYPPDRWPVRTLLASGEEREYADEAAIITHYLLCPHVWDAKTRMDPGGLEASEYRWVPGCMRCGAYVLVTGPGWRGKRPTVPGGGAV